VQRIILPACKNCFMEFTKKHFFLLMAVNVLLFFLAIKKDSYVEQIFYSFSFVIPVSFILFFFFWFLYYVVTGGKEPSIKFHLVSQCFTTMLILFFFGYFYFSPWFNRHYESNAGHNKYFLQSLYPYEYSLDNSLYKKGFALLEQKMEGRNDIRLTRRIKAFERIVITGSTVDTICTFYFMYFLKNHPKEFTSKHVTGKYVNNLVFYNVHANTVPVLTTLLADKNTDIEESSAVQPGGNAYDDKKYYRGRQYLPDSLKK
jgi:hypothetical protein